jgi:hypothetical protein
MQCRTGTWKANIRTATSCWGRLPRPARYALRELTDRYGFSVPLGEIRFLDGAWYVTHSGLLRLATRAHCQGIQVIRVKQLCDPSQQRWFFKAIVYKSRNSKGFVGYGDAHPANVSPLVRGSEMRLAETRAVSRALRKAYGIGLCSVEELGWTAQTPQDRRQPTTSSIPSVPNNGHSRLRDRLCLLIRQHQLDPALVKRYAAEFCGKQTLKEASRDLVESFIAQLAAFAKKDRDGLICKLNSYAQPVEATP